MGFFAYNLPKSSPIFKTQKTAKRWWIPQNVGDWTIEIGCTCASLWREKRPKIVFPAYISARTIGINICYKFVNNYKPELIKQDLQNAFGEKKIWRRMDLILPALFRLWPISRGHCKGVSFSGEFQRFCFPVFSWQASIEIVSETIAIPYLNLFAAKG